MRRYLLIGLLAVPLFLLIPFLPACAQEPRQAAQPASAEQGAQTSTERITATGIVKEQGFTSYMYGTHVLVDERGKTLYALKSDKIMLDSYVGRKVTVSGEPVPGYPVDNGPPYLDVTSLREEGG